MDVLYTEQYGPSWRASGTSPWCGVTADRSDLGFQVWVDAAEHVREEPLESRLRALVAEALAAVTGIDEAYEEDREVWTVVGRPDPEVLVTVVATALETIAAELDAFMAPRIAGEQS